MLNIRSLFEFFPRKTL